ncbi:hypothetical protein A3Q56_05786 [Intoshia linei]|uniref:N(6)-L-threonylcarbamoyladenine synthase n=1 Tax=Intoshia linei TaxID=1819745 RepID=A0A177AY98_9BILA|nr:hypothetical protein A3Q56_05786 [Intoshia linei]
MRFNHANVLGIETSCDDTGIAIVSTDKKIYFENVKSQAWFHSECGGIVPWVAKTMHLDNIIPLTIQVMNQSNLKMNDIDYIAVTHCPGLVISLDVGIQFAKYLSTKFQKPVIPIHHMRAHALIGSLLNNLSYPFLTLLISGAHCIFAIAHTANDFSLIGTCKDNAPGDVFDKIYRELNLKNSSLYSHLPCGAAVELCAEKANKENRIKNKFDRLNRKSSNCDASFSGIMSQHVYWINEMKQKKQYDNESQIPNESSEIAYSLQKEITEKLQVNLSKAIQFCKYSEICHNISVSQIVVSGGVACNKFILNGLKKVTDYYEMQIISVPKKYCTDNGTMIAWNGCCIINENLSIINDLNPLPRFYFNLG